MKISQCNYLILSLTSRCNLQCRYCYNSADQVGLDMSDATIDKALDLFHTNTPLHIQISGGEPTLVPAKIERVLKTSRKMKHRPRIGIQTNGTLLSPHLVSTFKKYRVELGISLDGPPEVQDTLRGKSNMTLKGMQLLEQASLPFRVTTVVNAINVLQLNKLVLLLAGFSGCRGIGLDLLVNKGKGTSLPPPSAQDLEKGVQAMVTTLDGINAMRREPIRLRELDLVVERRMINRKRFCYAHSGKSLAISPTGQLFPCSQTLGDPSFSLGDIHKPQAKSTLSLEKSIMRSTECESCSLFDHCPGDCPSRLHYNQGQTPLACSIYRSFDCLIRS